MLVQHCAVLAGQAPAPVGHLDTLVPLLLAMTQEVPYYATTVARARLKRMHERLQAALQARRQSAPAADASSAAPAAVQGSAPAAPEGPWPGARALLQVKLFATLFPVSDRRHPVVTPLTLLIGKYLSQCVVTNGQEAVQGLYLCSLALHCSGPARRNVPEVYAFLAELLAKAFVPTTPATCTAEAAAGASSSHGTATKARGQGASSSAGRRSGAGAATAAPADDDADVGALQAFERVPRGLLALEQPAGAAAAAAPGAAVGGKKAAAAAAAKRQGGGSSNADEAVTPLDLYAVLSCQGPWVAPSPSGAASGGAAQALPHQQRLQLLQAALHTVRRAAAVAGGSDVSDAAPFLPELLRPLRAALASLAALPLPRSLEALRSETAADLTARSEAVLAVRRPLVQTHRLKVPALRELHPRFEEEGFVKGRDYDPDRERAEKRKLKREVAKERRGAMRELRKDSAFMVDVRDRERAVVDAERMESQRRFDSELQKQESDMKSGGQRGMNPHLKKGKKK